MYVVYTLYYMEKIKRVCVYTLYIYIYIYKCNKQLNKMFMIVVIHLLAFIH